MDSRNTDLEQVKLVAHALLDVEIQPTEFSPMIVSHPFTNTGNAALPDEQGNFTPADLLNDPTDLERWRKRVGEQIDKSKSVYQIFMLVNKPYYLTFIKYAACFLSEKDLGQILSDAWIMSEFPNADRNVGTRELLTLFRSVSPEYLMDRRDWQKYQSLEDTVTVYRGVASADKGNIKALSWTLDRNTAEWFAHRFGKDGTVYTAQIKRDDIYAYFSGRKESEVIVDPDRLKKIMVAPRQQVRESMRMK